MKNLLPNRSDYYSQMNNERDGVNACQRTAAAQCLDIIGEIDKVPGPYKQPEDNIDWLANDKKSPFYEDLRILAYRSHGPGGGVPGQVGNILEWADVLCAAINKAVGYTAAAYHEFSAERIAQEIDEGRPVMVSCRFNPYTDSEGKQRWKIPGHYISVVGYEKRDESRYLLIADPYKNTLKNEPDGFGVLFSPGDWAQYYKGYGLRFFKRG